MDGRGKAHILSPVLAAALLLMACAWQAWADDRLAREIEAALADPRLGEATVGVQVCAADTGRVLYSHHASRQFIPASNQKILTAATAMRELGPRYEFRTALSTGAPVPGADGVLQGDLILRGAGDPTLGSPSAGEDPSAQFKHWAQELKAKGIHRVAGDLVVDDSFFDRVQVHPDWPSAQLWRAYCAPVSALSLNDNCLAVTVKPARAAGQKAKVTIWPNAPFLETTVTCRTHKGKHAVWFQRKPGSNKIVVGGNVKLGSGGYTGLLTSPDPALGAGHALVGVLRESGVALDGRVRRATAQEAAEAERRRVLAVRVMPLSRVLSVMLKESQNMYAEAVVKTVGAEKGGEGSWLGGLRRSAALLRDLKFGPDTCTLADGGGMSRNNRLSPAIICAVLVEMERTGDGAGLRGLMASAGEDGTLKRRLRQAQYKGRIRAKTGYLRGVGALSGYARTRGGGHVAFSILINDYKGGGNTVMKQVQDRIARAVVDHAGGTVSSEQ